MWWWVWWWVVTYYTSPPFPTTLLARVSSLYRPLLLGYNYHWHPSSDSRVKSCVIDKSSIFVDAVWQWLGTRIIIWRWWKETEIPQINGRRQGIFTFLTYGLTICNSIRRGSFVELTFHSSDSYSFSSLSFILEKQTVHRRQENSREMWYVHVTCLNQTWTKAGFGFTKPAFLGSRLWLRFPRYLRAASWSSKASALASWFTKALIFHQSFCRQNAFGSQKIAWFRLLTLKESRLRILDTPASAHVRP